MIETALLARRSEPAAGRGMRSTLPSGLVVLGATALVAVGAATFAHFFRESLFAVANLATGRHSSIDAAFHARGWLVFLAVTAGVTLGAFLGRSAVRWKGERLGIVAVAAAARGDGDGPSFRATAVRTAGTWTATAALASLGRESSIIETGAGLGTVTGRAIGRPVSHFATTGIAAAFAAAYHAPIAAVLYVEEHLGVRHDRRTAIHAVAGSATGYLIAQHIFGAHAILPHGTNPFSIRVVLLALVALVPAFIVSRVFVEARERLTPVGLCGPESTRVWLRSAALAAVVGAIVAFVPLTAGNGLEALRHAATDATLGVALAMMLAKLVATSAAIGAGAPGGIVSPSLAVAAGAALVSFVALSSMGVSLGTFRWDAVLVVMAVGIAVSVRSPLVAIVLVPEMSGDLRYIPLSALVVLGAMALDKAVDRLLARSGAPIPPIIHAEDA